MKSKVQQKQSVFLFSRCLVDGGFANIKRLYRRSDVDSLQQLVDVVNKSATSNIAVPYIPENGEEAWQWRDWKTFLSQKYIPLKGIQKLYRFQFRADEPGFVFVKTDVNGPEVMKRILKKNVNIQLGDRPCVLEAAGLTRDRQQYLYHSVRPYVRERYQDLTCPAPQEE